MEEVIKKKRGRPRKNPVPEVPQEIKSIVEEVQEKQQEIQQQLQEELKELPKEEVTITKIANGLMWTRAVEIFLHLGIYILYSYK